MTPRKRKEALAALRWTQSGFARLLGYDEKYIRKWLAGEAEMPAADTWLERLVDWLKKNPPPRKDNR